MTDTLCPRGHQSSESDYCSECGARMEAAAPEAAAAPAHCPACGAMREPPDALFCEICGYNFESGTDAPAPPPPPVASEAPTVPAASTVSATSTVPGHWTATISVAPAAHGPGSPEPPPDVPAATVPLKPGSNLVGRRSVARAIFPELDLSFDNAVSHRHALLDLTPDGVLTLRDIGSGNGTLRNGQAVTPLVDVALSPGDTLELGHWTRITIGNSPEEAS